MFKTIEWISCVSKGIKLDQTFIVTNSKSANQSDKTNCISENTSEYAVIRKSQDADEEKKELKSDIPSRTEEEEKANETLANLNIPEAFLNSSMSATTFAQAKTEQSFNNSKLVHENPNKEQDEAESDDSTEETYEHLYENIDAQSKETRSYTVYEEVYEAPGEYVPPMPPSLPKRQPDTSYQKSTPVMSQDPNALRLQKLCESVTEALKIAEDTPSEPAVKGKFSHKRSHSETVKKKEAKALRKHHSLKSSPKLRVKKSEVSEGFGDMKRVVSDSGIKRPTIGCNLQHMPFNTQEGSGTTSKKEPITKKPIQANQDDEINGLIKL